MLPLIIVGAVLLGGAGVKKAVDGKSMAGRADDISKSATLRLVAARGRLERATKSGEAAFKRLDQDRASAQILLTDDIAATLRQIASVDQGGFSAFETAMTQPERLAVALGAPSLALTSFTKAGVKGLGAGLALSGAAQGAVATFGAASTGSAISGLGGAAATNATLAWFGGGSIASGGFGMAGGAAVLGGVVAGPALLLAGLAYANNAEERLTQATDYAEKVAIAIEKGKAAESRVAAVKRRAIEIRKAIKDVSKRARAIMQQLNTTLDGLPHKGRSFPYLTPDIQNRALLLGVLAGLLSDLVEVAIVDEAASLLDDSGAVLARVYSLTATEKA